VWYPGAEPGGGGYIAQRMLAAKNENHAMGATLLFNVAHYALRPWPWILIALASLVVFPDLASIQQAFPNITPDKLGHDLGYPAMLSYLPAGLLGLVVASLIAAFMSTLSTQLNWGSSYLVNDFYKRFVKPEADEKELVRVGRLSTVGLMILAAIMALILQDALQGFNILLQIGAGTGLIFILRWFWWRINAFTELWAMIISFVVAIIMELVLPRMGIELSQGIRLAMGVGITTVGWVTVTLMTKPETQETLLSFFNLTKPHSIGWQPVLDQASRDGEKVELVEGSSLGTEIACMVIGSFAVYGALFATGFWIYGNTVPAIISTALALAGGYFLIKTWSKVTPV
jgi:Na+/proline symporter